MNVMQQMKQKSAHAAKKEERVADALRENLRKRKEQQQAKAKKKD